MLYTNNMDIITEVKKLNLDPEDYIVIGSGILSALKIRSTDDVDLVVTKEVYAKYKAKGWAEKIWAKGDPTISKGIYEMGTDWGDDTSLFSLQELMADKVIVDGVNFISLNKLKQWKLAKGRAKDLADVTLINEYIKTHENISD